MIQVVQFPADETSPEMGLKIGSQNQTRITENEKAGRVWPVPPTELENHIGRELYEM